MPLRSEFFPLLADPGPESWRAICKLLDDPRVTDAQRLEDARQLAAELKSWPKEVDRPPSSGADWTAVKLGALADNAVRDALIALCWRVREVDLYRLYIDAACKTPPPDLVLRDGRPAVRLSRVFTGAMQGAGGRVHSLGVEGQADLCGSLCVEWETTRTTDGREWKRLPVPIEVEVKKATGRLRPAQAQRQEALAERCELYVVVRRVDEMLRALVAERQRVLALVGAL